MTKLAEWPLLGYTLIDTQGGYLRTLCFSDLMHPGSDMYAPETTVGLGMLQGRLVFVARVDVRHAHCEYQGQTMSWPGIDPETCHCKTCYRICSET
jgi:hypothetical protein